VAHPLCVVTTPCVRRDDTMCARDDTMCASWRHHVCVVTTPCVRRGDTMCASWRHHVCVVATPYVRRGDTICASWRHHMCVVATPYVRRGDTMCASWRHHVCVVATHAVHRGAKAVRHCAHRGTPFRQTGAPFRQRDARCREPRSPLRTCGAAGVVSLVDRREEVGLEERWFARERGDRGGFDLVEQDVCDVVVDGGGNEAGIRRVGIHAGVVGAHERGLDLERADDEERDGPLDALRMKSRGHARGGGAESLDDPGARPGIEEAGRGFAPLDGVTSQLDAFRVQNVSDPVGTRVEQLREAGDADAGLPVHPEEAREGSGVREAWRIRAAGHGVDDVCPNPA
jgi:hypothetical protein